jgi:excisionase family DNA binding protein
VPDRPPVERLALSLPEAARALGVSEKHLRSHLHELPVVRLGGRVLIPVDPLREFLRKNAEAGTLQEASTDAIVESVMESLDD